MKKVMMMKALIRLARELDAVFQEKFSTQDS
jgi:hypothetical protein